MNATTTKVPRQLWIVGIIAVLWNAIGAFDYAATQFRLDFYMSQFTPEQLEYFYGYPAWAVAPIFLFFYSRAMARRGVLR